MAKESLVEATVRNLYNAIHDKAEDVDGVMNGVLVVTDPSVNTEEYEEIIDRAQEIIANTPDGEIPIDDAYIGQYLQLCPICGTSFIEDHILEPGTACPICQGEPEAFELLGQVQGEVDAIASETDGNLVAAEEVVDKQEEEEEANGRMDKEEDEESGEPDLEKDVASKQLNGNKLQECISQEDLNKIDKSYM